MAFPKKGKNKDLLRNKHQRKLNMKEEQDQCHQMEKTNKQHFRKSDDDDVSDQSKPYYRIGPFEVVNFIFDRLNICSPLSVL